MAIDVETIDSPGWWLRKLDRKRRSRLKHLEELHARYTGDAPLPRSLKNAPRSAQAFYRTARTNLAEMVVKAVRYRLAVTAIITPSEQGETGDAQAWDLWRRSGMLSEQHDVARTMLWAGDGYVLTADYQGTPAATAEDPRQVVTIHDPVRQANVRASGKFFHDADYGRQYAYLYRAGRRWVAYRDARSARITFSSSWDWSPDHGGAEGESIPIDQPVVRYRNEEGVGEFDRHSDILDRIDHLVLQGMAIATFQAFKQRAIKADWDEVEEDAEDQDGRTASLDDVLQADPGAVWKLPQSADMWESGAVDLTPITSMATKEIERLSAVTFTPLWMFIQEGQNQTAAGVSLVREGLTFKVLDRQARAGYAHAQVMANLYRIAEVADAPGADQIEVVWQPAERYGLSEKYEAARAAKEAGVPWRTIMREVLQFPPEQVSRMEAERVDEALLAELFAPQSLPAADETAAP
ncbi:MAG: hypothetical protein Q4G67_03100 [Actinomycetia bacterium]|nr:hypothetical protein [Actinomycetes bacterium]